MSDYPLNLYKSCMQAQILGRSGGSLHKQDSVELTNNT